MARPRNEPDANEDPGTGVAMEGIAVPADGTEVELPAEPEDVYRLRLKKGTGAAKFQAGHQAVELTEENPVFETTDRRLYLGARDLPFLEEASQ